jgi:hypothetical protein
MCRRLPTRTGAHGSDESAAGLSFWRKRTTATGTAGRRDEGELVSARASFVCMLLLSSP